MIRKLFFAALVLIFALPAFAKQVDVETAKNVARTFWTQNLGKQTRSPFSDVTSQTEFTKFYILNTGDGFVIVAADDIASPILGYSDAGNFDPQNIPVNTRGWLLGYENEIGWGISNGVSASEEIAAEWEKLSSGQGLTPKRSGSVNPLIQTRWDQIAPYSNFCPGFTGCVATAMAQVMKYWSYPTRGIGSHTYHPTLVSVGDLSADFENTTYDWDNMLNIYTPSATQEQQDAVATLMLHCGVAVEMIYGLPSGSGAQTISGGLDIPCAENALKNFFGYKTTIQGLLRDDYTDTNWINILKAELDASRPIIYTGAPEDPEDENVSHAFICDGYKSNNYFHFNFGWGGGSDGYYLIDAVTANGDLVEYSYHQDAIIGIEPNASAFDFLVVTPLNLSFESEGGTMNFTIKANNNVAEEWTAVSNAEWLTLSATSGEGNGAITTVIATANENTSHTDRNATITVTHGSEIKIISVVSKHSHSGEFYLDLSVNNSSLGYLPDFNGWWNPDYNPSIGDVYIRHFNEHLIAAHPYPHTRFVDWNYYGDSIGVRTDEYCHNYISVDFEDGYELVHDTLAINATFASVHSGDTLLYDSGQEPFRAYYGTSDTATYYRWGVKFDPSTLSGITEIPQVEAYLGCDLNYSSSPFHRPCTYTIQLWQGGNDSPQTQLHTQAYTVSDNDDTPRWHLIRFSTPVAIDNTQPLWITINCTMSTHNNGDVPPLFTSGYCGNPNSNYIWTSETGWTHYNLNGSWNFAPESNVHTYSWLIRAYSAVVTGVTTSVAYEHTAEPTEPGNDYVIGGGVYDIGSSVTLTAVPDNGHCFKYWGWRNSDTPNADLQWVYDNPVTFTLSNNVTYTAYFSHLANLSISSNNYAYGDVSGEGFSYGAANIAVGSTTTITAEPHSNGIFRRWEWYYKCNPSVVYQVTENPYTFTVEGDASYTAVFEEYINYISVTANANNNDWGSITGDGTYNQGTNVRLTASPSTNYYFSHWEWYYNDSPSDVHQSTNNPINFTAELDVTYIAIFAPMIHIITLTNWSPPCNVIGGGYYMPGSNVSLTAEPYQGFNFTHWEWYFADTPSDVHQSTNNPINFSAERDAYYYAYFDGDITTTHITVHANNDNWGRVSGSGDYQTYETAILRAEPHDGYRFLYWGWDGFDMTFEDNPFALTLAPGMDSECSFTGYFESISGIDDNTDDNIVIYSLYGCIIVEGADGETVTIYDMTGRIVRDCGLTNGVYMVKVGDRAPRKVVVAR